MIMLAPPANGMDLFLDSSVRRRYPAKSVMMSGGDVPESLYYVVEGSVAVVIKDLDDNEIVISYLYAGDMFGESGLFDQKAPQNLLVVAHVECMLAEMKYDQFRSLSADHPDLWHEVSSQTAARLHRTNNKVHDLAFFDVKRRVISTILDLAKTPDASVQPDGMQFHATRKELARISGCSAGSVGSVLKELEDRGLIHTRGSKIIVYGTR